MRQINIHKAQISHCLYGVILVGNLSGLLVEHFLVLFCRQEVSRRHFANKTWTYLIRWRLETIFAQVKLFSYCFLNVIRCSSLMDFCCLLSTLWAYFCHKTLPPFYWVLLFFSPYLLKKIGSFYYFSFCSYQKFRELLIIK